MKLEAIRDLESLLSIMLPPGEFKGVRLCPVS